MNNINSVLYVSFNDLSLPNGPGVNESEFLNTLSKRYDHSSTACIFEPSNELIIEGGASIYYARKSKLSAPFNHFFDQIYMFIKLYKLLNSRSFDLVVFRLSYLPLCVYMLHKIFNFTYSIKTAGLNSDNLIKLGGWRSILAKLLFKVDFKITKYVLNKAVAIDACTLQLVSGIKKTYGVDPDKIIHVENATNVHSFKPSIPDEYRKFLGLQHFNQLIGYVGGSPSSRGAKELINILPVLSKKYDGLGVLIVGYDQNLDSLKELARRLGVYDKVVFAGSVLYCKVPSYIAALDVGVAFDDPQKLLVTGNSNQKVRQYISSGKPVISSILGNDFIEENALGSRIDHTDDDAIINSLDMWLSKGSDELALHQVNAHNFAKENLSVEVALDRRINFWNEQLSLS